MSQTRQLRVLLLEDVDADAELMVHALERSGVSFSWKHAKDREAFAAALADSAPDVILADYSLPRFNGREALQMALAARPDVPVIMVSGSLVDESALELIRTGARDYVLKSNLVRLGSAVQRAVTEADDLRERRRARAQLAESEARFRGIVETAQEGIWMLEGGRTAFMNRRMAEMLGLDPAVAAGIPLEDLVDQESRPTLDRNLRKLAEPGVPVERFDCRLRRADGTLLWTSIAMSRSEGGGTRPGDFLAMVTDVSTQRKLQEQIMVSDRMASVGTLAASVAHEINNPLAAMMGNLQLAVEDAQVGEDGPAPDPSRWKALREELDDAVECADRIRAIARDLRVFAHTQQSKIGPVDLQAVMESALRMARNEVHHRATVTRDWQPVRPVLGDEARLGQVFLNLIVNAAQAIDAGHADENRITIRTRDLGQGRVAAEVVDTGCGMSPETLGRSEEPFFTTKAPGVGTGLGLPICRKIVSEAGGRMEIESTPGKGTLVRVILPAATAPVSTGEPGSGGTVIAAPRRARVLVVDDEEMIGQLLRRALESEHEVEVEASGRKAVARIAAGERFDVVLCDLMMPEVSGMEVHREVTKLQPRLAADFVFMSGGAFTPEARAFLDRVPNARIDKPFDLLDLRNAVNARLRPASAGSG
jgi:PAS domain S-box-containing protein